MSDTMSFNSASTVFVFNVNPPDSSAKGRGGATVIETRPGVTVQPPTVQPPTEEHVTKLEEPTQKQNRIQELLTHVPGSALETIAPPPDAASFKGEEASVPKEGLPKPPCTTEQPVPANLVGKADPLALQVGFNGEIPRWKPGSVINYAVYANGFPSAGDAQHAAEQLCRAANEWNSRNIGVTFEWVAKLEDACFVLSYGGTNGSLLAVAFFPNGNDLNNVQVFQGAFTTAWRPHMWEVFTHELGHVLGLRHEFAVEKEGGAVQWGPKDEYSVMNYRAEPPKITAHDENCTKEFYKVPTGSWIGGMQVKDWIPDN